MENNGSMGGDLPETGNDRSRETTSGIDDILGTEVDRSESWSTQEGVIYKRGEVFSIKGVNLTGLETSNGALLGQWESGVTTETLLDVIQCLGFNSIRLPVIESSIRSDFAVLEGWRVGTDMETGTLLDTGRKHLEDILAEANERGLSVLLDYHSCDDGHQAGRPDACPGSTVEEWLSDLALLSEISVNYDNVLGIDLFNEPHELTWDAWKDLAERAAAVVLEKNPKILVFVEGVGSASPYGEHNPFWGENLSEALAKPVEIPSARLVYSPHVYGPGVAEQSYFSDADFPESMPEVWDSHFGFLFASNQTVAIGEFGGWYDDAKAAGEVAWNERFVSYLAALAENKRHFFYWVLGPDSVDTGGLLDADWHTPVKSKTRLLSSLLGDDRGNICAIP